MNRRRVTVADVFTTEPLCGTRVSVVPEAAELEASDCRTVADELPGPTAFLSHADGERRLRVFGRSGRLDRADAAGIAAVGSRFDADELDPGTYEVRNGDRTSTFRIEDSGIVRIAFSGQSVRPVPAAEATLAETLGLETGAIITDELPVAVAATDRPYLVVPLDYLSSLGAVSTEPDSLADLLSTHDADAVVAFTFDTLDRESSLHARQFGPAGRTAETPVAADASGAVGAYLEYADAFEEFPDELVVEQGHYLDRPGRARVTLDPTLRVGGHVTTSLRGELSVPPGDDEDEIIEV